MHRSRKHHSLSFTKFVARLQHTFSSKNLKSSTVIIQQQQQSQPRFQLSEILYDPSRPIEYISEIKDKENSSESFSSFNSTNLIQEDQFNLSKMNISYHHHQSPEKLVKLPNSFNTIRLHSTAIHDLSNF